MTLPDTLSAISSPASADGPMQQGLLDGLMIDQSGPEVAPVSHSPSRVGGRGSKISGIYGPTSIASSVHPGHLSLWENRLRERLGTLGSTEWALTWRRKPTPGGRSISRLAASTRPKSGIAFTGWPAPTAQPDGKSPEAHLAMKQRMGERDGSNSNRTAITDLQVIAKALCGWPAPVVPNGGRRPKGGAMTLQGQTPDGKKRQVDLDYVARALTGWTAPQAHDTGKPDAKRWRRYGTEHGGANLNDEAAMVLAGRAAPVVNDATGSKYAYSSGDHNKPVLKLPGQAAVAGITGCSSDPTRKASTGALNPDLPRWLQGYPEEWGKYAGTGTRLRPRLRRK